MECLQTNNILLQEKLDLKLSLIIKPKLLVINMVIGAVMSLNQQRHFQLWLVLDGRTDVSLV